LKDVAGMLKSKHQDKFLVEKFGWPDLHALSLDKICAVCKTMENWLNSDPQNVVVLYCKYIYYFAGLLSGSKKMNSSLLFLHKIHIPALCHTLPTCFCLCYSDIQGPNSKMLCVNIKPALLLKGDILVKCYHRLSVVSKRECVFRAQFHTCSVLGSQLDFGKRELDHAYAWFPVDAIVKFLFSSGPQRRGTHLSNPGVSVDYGSADPIVRWDSYENFNIHQEDSVKETIRHMYSYPTHVTHLPSPLSHSQSSHSHTLPT
uniref:C2 tensin-type domain-containing protein n=1 Tax=Cyprinus carpio TaxID=7962 RepID=A0A8C1K338_CYPCA